MPRQGEARETDQGVKLTREEVCAEQQEQVLLPREKAHGAGAPAALPSHAPPLAAAQRADSRRGGFSPLATLAWSRSMVSRARAASLARGRRARRAAAAAAASLTTPVPSPGGSPCLAMLPLSGAPPPEREPLLPPPPPIAEPC